MNPTLSEHCRERLREIEAAGLLRRLQSWEQGDSRAIQIEGRELLHFASNDYLGLGSHPRVRQAFAAWDGNSLGAGASRLITGNHSAYETLEHALADFKKMEAALVFTSGYAAALGTIPALVGPADFIVMDKLCHASLVDGARLSGATLRVYPHRNLKRCEELLALCRAKAGDGGNVLLVTESVFSMDGDLAPLAELAALKRKCGAWLMVDEAHATGVFGTNGRSGAEHFGVESDVDVSMGTLSKALGCVGGFICGSREMKELLVNRARSLIYSTGLPAPLCAAATEAIHVAREQPDLRARLWENVRLLSEKLGVRAVSPIVPILVGDERRCLEIAARLREDGFLTPAIRYPTVARGKARLRISLSAAHTPEDILRLAEALRPIPRGG